VRAFGGEDEAALGRVVLEFLHLVVRQLDVVEEQRCPHVLEAVSELNVRGLHRDVRGVEDLEQRLEQIVA
jgi:hypothetical protein